MFRAIYLSFLFFILLCLRWWDLPAEFEVHYPRFRWRISSLIANLLTDREDYKSIMEPS